MKTAHAVFLFLAILAMPPKVLAVDTDFASAILNYPDRTINTVASWFSPKTVSQTQVLGAVAPDFTGQNVIDDQNQVQDLSGKLESTGSALDQLYINYQQVAGETILMGLKWDDLTVSDVLQSLDRLNNTLGENTRLTWLIQSWGWPQLDELMLKENSIKTNLATIRDVVSTSGMQIAAYDQLRDAAHLMEQISALIGEKTDGETKSSLYGRFQHAQLAAGSWDNLLGELRQMQTTGNYGNLEEVGDQVLVRNLLPNINPDVTAAPQNRCLELVAMILANKQLLANNYGSTVSMTWVEDNPLQFNTLVSNSSLLSRQVVNIKYYLPAELSESDVLQHDPNLRVKLDPDRNRLLVEGMVVVAAGDTRVVGVETADLWQFDSVYLASLQSQSSIILSSLSGGSKFIRALELKGKIDGLSQRINNLASQKTIPEERIRAYRQIQLQNNELNNTFIQLQRLVAKNKLFEGGKNFINWSGAAMLSGGLGFGIIGIAVLRKTKKSRFGWAQKTAVPQHFNVFTAGIANTDF